MKILITGGERIFRFSHYKKPIKETRSNRI